MKKLAFSLIRGESGGDIYFENIKRCIEGSLDMSTDYFDNSYKFLPFLTRKSESKAEIFHCINGQVLWNLRKKKGYKVFSITHLMDQTNYKNHMNILQKTYYNLIFNRYLKKSLPYADRIVSISKYSQKKLKEVLGFDSEVIYPCIDIEKFKPEKIKSNEKIKIFFAGNSSKRKGFDLLPKIMSKLGDGFELSCTGLRDYDSKFKNMKYLGKLNTEELVRAYNECDIFLFPSRLEGFGLSVAEAMSCGKPCVITNCSSLPEVMDSNGGFLCERDNVNDFVEKIKILASEKKLREKMGNYNRKRIIEKFSYAALKESYLKLYNHA